MSDELDSLQAIASDDVDELVLLRASSRTILLLAMQRLPRSPDAWLNSENPLDDVSQTDFDDLEAMMDNAIHDVMTGVTMYAPPVGTIQMFGGSTPPAGWLSCDHSSLLRASYPGLFAVIGTTFGAIDGTHFYLPDFRTRFPVGIGSVSSYSYAMGDEGGNNTVQLTEDTMPAHTHQNGRGNAGSGHSSWTAANVGSYISFQTSESTGGDMPHENRPPFLAVMFIIYAGV